jgi:asparagine synthase (glutamine-hydrolysing)
MCGIAGFLNEPGQVPDLALLKGMCDRLIHRGPDAAGYFRDPGVALGHRRLSIIDVAGGDQPLGNEDGRIQIVFNGEIYNFQELQRDLLEKGHRFTTRSDTEVLVHLYEEVGERLPEFLNGMFAFAIWDGPRQKLFLARDRFGKKPLYYSCHVPEIRFCFASELGALEVLPGFERAINEQAVADFLSLSYVPDPETIYRNVFKLEPGHSLTVTRSGSRTVRKYWEPPFAPSSSANFDQTIEELQALAQDAVERRLMSDVPLGAFLSGGVDSSFVVASMARKASRIKTFTIGSHHQDFDERDIARTVVERYGTDHHEKVVVPSPEILSTLISRFDEPFGDSSAIPTLYLAQMTRQHVTVALSGDGADELFGGYRRYFFGTLEERLRGVFPQWFRQSAVRIAGRYYPKFDYLPQVFRAKTLLTNVSDELAGAYFTSMSVFRDASLNAVLGPDVRSMLRDYTPRQRFSEHFAAVRELPPLEQMQAVDMKTYLPGDILVKVDRATMAYSLEARAPWLDYRIAELAGRVPASFKQHGRIGKYIFKKAAAPYVPSPVITRRKMGFSVPIGHWFRGSLKSTFQSAVLEDSHLPSLLNVREVRRIWEEHQSGFYNHDRKLWNLLMLASWYSGHCRRRTADAESWAGDRSRMATPALREF